MKKTANQNLQDFFNQYNKKQNKYDSKVSSKLTDIMMHVNKISEKDFSRVEELQEKADVLVAVNEHLVIECEKKNKRPELCAELIFEKVNRKSVKASKKKENHISLTEKERKEVKDKFGNNLGCSFSKDKDGYFCHTHRSRSKSYESVKKIPKKDVEFIESTGSNKSIIKESISNIEDDIYSDEYKRK